jgi:hypothetical protein
MNIDIKNLKIKKMPSDLGDFIDVEATLNSYQNISKIDRWKIFEYCESLNFTYLLEKGKIKIPPNMRN